MSISITTLEHLRSKILNVHHLEVDWKPNLFNVQHPSGTLDFKHLECSTPGTLEIKAFQCPTPLLQSYIGGQTSWMSSPFWYTGNQSPSMSITPLVHCIWKFLNVQLAWGHYPSGILSVRQLWVHWSLRARFLECPIFISGIGGWVYSYIGSQTRWIKKRIQIDMRIL